MNIVAQGRRGTITCTEQSWQKIATKRANEPQHAWAIRKEYEILHKLQQEKVSFVPHVVSSDDTSFSYYRIEGEPLKKKRDDLDAKQRTHVLTQLVHHAYVLDTVGVEHGELSRPSTNVLINDENEVFIVDFERGSINEFSGRNLKAIAQRLHAQGFLSIAGLRRLGEQSLETIRDTLLHSLNARVQPVTRIAGRMLLPIGLIALDLRTKRLFYDQRIGEHLLLLTPAFNTGVGRSIPVPLLRTTVVTGIFLVLLFRRGRHQKNHRLAIMLLIAGAIGNLIDRIRLGGVRDFIDLQVWPIFNVADILISVGVIILLLIESWIRKTKSV